MPWKIKEEADEYLVVTKDTGKVVGRHPSRTSAVQHMSALYANVDDAKALVDITAVIYQRVALALKTAHDVSGEARDDSGKWTTGGARLTQDDLSDAPSTDEQYEVTAERVAKAWKVDRESLDALAVEGKYPIDGKSDAEAKRMIAYTLLRKWGGSSGGAEATMAALGAAEHVGVEFAPFASDDAMLRWMADNPKVSRALRTFGVGMYETTQSTLEDMGVQSVRVMRSGGHALDRLFSSWATSWGGVRHENNGELVGEVVPRKYVLSLPKTGFGTRAESEVVLLPRPRKEVRVFAPRTKSLYSQVAEQLKSSHDVSEEARDSTGKWTTGGRQGKRDVVDFDERPQDFARYKDAPDLGRHMLERSEIKELRQHLKNEGRLNPDGRTTPLYHVTDADTAKLIMERGLIPGAQAAPGQSWAATHSKYATYFHGSRDAAIGNAEQAGEGWVVVQANIPVTQKSVIRFLPDEDVHHDPLYGLQALRNGEAVAYIGGVPKSALSVIDPWKTGEARHYGGDGAKSLTSQMVGEMYVNAKGMIAIRALELKGFDPTEARDETGKWTDSGSAPAKFDFNGALQELSPEGEDAVHKYAMGNLSSEKLLQVLADEDDFRARLQDDLREAFPSGVVTVYRGGALGKGDVSNGTLSKTRAETYASGFTGFKQGKLHTFQVPVENFVGVGHDGEGELFFRIDDAVKVNSVDRAAKSLYGTVYAALKAQHSFASTQVNLPKDLASQVRALGAQVKDSDLAGDGRETVPHITVKYGLDARTPEDVAALLRSQPPARITLGRLSAFLASETGSESDVLKLEVDSPDLERLNKLLSESVAHTTTY